MTEPTDKELEAFAIEEQFLLFCDTDEFTQIARAVLAKWGTPPAVVGEPAGWMWQHDETGRTGFVDCWQVENGWQENNPRLRLISKLYTTPQPTKPRADSQPAPQGETNAQLDTDSNPPTPGQQRDVAGPVALGQPVGNGSDQAAGHTGAQGDKLLTVAERNIRSFLRSAVFKSESDREAALSCVDVLWEAARAPADSVTAPAAYSGNIEQELAMLIRRIVSSARRNCEDGSNVLKLANEAWVYLVRKGLNGSPLRDAGIESDPTPAAQAADSVLEDAGGANWQDISTAPKDGTRFVAVGNNYGLYSEMQHTCIAQWFRGCWIEASDWNETSELKYLTHWMPLLPLPGGAARKQGANHD